MTTETVTEEGESLEIGDLGLGQGLKPGALAKDVGDYDSMQFTMFVHSPAGVRSRSSSVNEADGDIGPNKRTLKFTDRFKWLGRKQSSLDNSRPRDSFASLTQIPIGTSLTQQRELFERELREMMKKNGITDTDGLLGKFKLRLTNFDSNHFLFLYEYRSSIHW